MSKNSAIFRASGAPPETVNRRRPPKRSRTLAKTNRRATAYCARARSGGRRPAHSASFTRRPTAIAHPNSLARRGSFTTRDMIWT